MFLKFEMFFLKEIRDDLLSEGIVFTPDSDELAEMVGTQDGAVPGQVVEAVHDDGDHDVQHDERTQEDEGYKVQVSHVGPENMYVTSKTSF
jgi:hypothetical protein